MSLFIAKPGRNKKAATFVIALLLVILAININNIVYSTRLYLEYHLLAGYARGMVLLIGPLIYFYALSALKPDFKLKWVHGLHLLPYLFFLTYLVGEFSQYDKEGFLAVMETFMNGTMPIDVWDILTFIIYSLHLEAYLLAVRREVNRSIRSEQQNYLTPIEHRVKWLKNLTIHAAILVVIFSFLAGYMIFTGVYSVSGNYTLILVLSILVYLIAYKSILDRNIILPDFEVKYRSLKVNLNKEEGLLQKLNTLMEKEKVYRQPDLKLADLAEQLNAPQHVISQLINNRLQVSFFELLNKYRIEDFKILLRDPKYSNYTILGLANEVGYNSKSSFNTAFKKHTGMTPSQFKNSENRSN